MASENFKLCHRYLYHSSQDMIVDETIYRSIFQKGDGYGELSIADLDNQGLWYDWSHIRDSSDKAVATMAGMLKEHFFKLAFPN